MGQTALPQPLSRARFRTATRTPQPEMRLKLHQTARFCTRLHASARAGYMGIYMPLKAHDCDLPAL